MSEKITGTAREQGDLWSAAGRDWAELMAPTVTPVSSACLDLARVTRGSRVLDVGCGTGELLALARFRGADGAGVDPAADFLEIARERLPDADVRRGVMEDIPHEDDAFDAVVLSNCLMFSDDRERALREVRRVLRPEGRLAVAVWTERASNDFRHVIAALVDLLPEPPDGEGPFALSPPGVLSELLETAGFEPVAERVVPSPFAFADEDHYLRAVQGTGPGQGVLRQVDRETVDDALLTVGEEFRLPDGGYRLENGFRVVAATPTAE